MAKFAEQTKKGKSFIVVKQSKPLFKISPIAEDEEWEEAVDFTKVKKGGVSIEDLVSRL